MTSRIPQVKTPANGNNPQHPEPLIEKDQSLTDNQTRNIYPRKIPAFLRLLVTIPIFFLAKHMTTSEELMMMIVGWFLVITFGYGVILFF